MINAPMLAIEQFCETGSGGTPSRANERYFGGTIPWVKSGELREAVITDTEEKITDLGMKESSAKIVPNGSILVAMYGATVGRTAVLGIDAATNQAVCSIRPDPKKADTRYMFHALQSKMEHFLSRAAGGAQPNISQGIIRETKIPLPLLDEQRRIAAILDKADELRRNSKSALRLLESTKSSIFSAMFGSIDDLRGRGDVAKLGDLISDQRIGLVRAGSELALHPPGVPYLRMDAIGKDGNLDLTALKFTNASAAEVVCFSLNEGDLLFNTRNSRELVGKTAIFYGKEQILYNNNILRIRFSTRVTPEYMLSYFRSRAGMRELDARKAGTTSVFAIYQKSLIDFPVVVPPIARQQEFSRKVLGLAAQALNFQKQSDSFEALFSSLQHRAFTGQL